MIFGLFDLHKKNICSLLPTTVWHEMFLVQMELNTFFSYRIHYMFDCFQKKILIQLYRVKISNFWFFFLKETKEKLIYIHFWVLKNVLKKISFFWMNRWKLILITTFFKLMQSVCVCRIIWRPPHMIYHVCII